MNKKESKFYDVYQLVTEEDKKYPVYYEYLMSFLESIENKIPKKQGERIIKEYNDKDYQIGISRAPEGNTEDIFKNGFKVFGNTDTSYGISYYDQSAIEHIMLLHQYCASPYYKDTSKLYIFKIPKESILYYEEGKSKPILYPEDETNELGNKCYRVLPEYILGYFPVGKELDDFKDFVENPNYKEKHDYKSEGLEFEERVADDKRRQEENKEEKTEKLQEIYTRLDNEFSNKNDHIGLIGRIKSRILGIFNRRKMLPEASTNIISNSNKTKEDLKSTIYANVNHKDAWTNYEYNTKTGAKKQAERDER